MAGRRVGYGWLEEAHAGLNAAYNALAVDLLEERLAADAALARDYVAEARAALAGGLAGQRPAGEAAAAARAVLPRLERALMLLDRLCAAPDPLHVAPVLDELGLAMDHVERALGAVGWD